ncbi:hypothetical protein FXN63_11855 [Pigmentiphaga aceris]|uniref:Uncharacterized protein n=1 Tax=Pigmentiphaga aceris TaxID=1940612 RepID=A0A5C0AVR4_9BURK|nr:hypothetical protein [Pigmentiphaga aceris]QEI06448.1 hypothetical protein FXN63_11855 [Pigmentiphaga aceris]
MPDTLDATTLLTRFIDDEDAALAAGRQGKFWPANHYQISPLFTKADRLLEPTQRVRLYTHVMRIAGLVPAVSDKELPLLTEAYRVLLVQIDENSFGHLAGRLELLFCFGFDDQGYLPSGPTSSAAELKARLKLVNQLGKYTSLPGQRDKLKNLQAFSGEAVRVLEVLRHLRYRHTRRADHDEHDWSISLMFWGFVLIGLLSPSTRVALVQDLIGNVYALTHQDRRLAILHETVQAVLPLAEDDADFVAQAAKLAAIAKARRDATESVALVRNLNLPFGDDEDWRIHIVLQRDSNPDKRSYAPDLSLEIAPEPDYPWRLRVETEAGQYSEWAGHVTQNDLGITALGAGQLHAFPAWLTSMRDKHGLNFVLAEPGDIRCGRKRAAAKLIEKWLALPDA